MCNTISGDGTGQAGGEVASMAWGRKDSNPSFGGLLGSPGN